MTSVYITRTGQKYHARTDCPSLVDAERELGRAIDRWPVDLKGVSKTPCSVCWPREPGWGGWRQLAHTVEREGDSLYEVVFVEQVLRHVKGLSPGEVTIQQSASGHSGKRYDIDFVVYPNGGHRVAVEVDGDDKDPGNRSVDEIRRAVETRRADLVANGWLVLNFGNERVSTRSAECVTELRAAIFSAVPARSDAQGRSVEATLGNTTSRAPRSKRGWVFAVGGLAILTIVAIFVLWPLVGESNGSSVDPVDGECPSEAAIKGNLAQSGERIYHEPGWRYYESTGAEECFASADDAKEAGYRASEVR